MKEGPFNLSAEDDTDVLFRELKTYRKTGTGVIIETAMRTYFDDGDYQDTVSYQPLERIANEV
jgi:hypothetical protein